MVKEIIVTFDGTDYCYIVIEDAGRRSEKKCCEAKEVLVRGVECTINGFSDRPGFLMECKGRVECSEGKLVVKRT